MVIDLRGVVPDGSVCDDKRLLENPRKPMRFVQGSTLVVRLSVFTAAGAPVDLADDPGVTLYLTVKKPPPSSTTVLAVTGSLDALAGKNRATFSLTPVATKYIEPGRYAYDVWLTYNGVRDAIIPTSSLHIEPGLKLP